MKVLSLRREAEEFNHGNHEGTRKNTEDLTTENTEYTEEANKYSLRLGCLFMLGCLLFV